mgnify:CR=1 FL=1
MKQTFEEFKKEWEKGSVVNQIQWDARGNNYQREFYIFDGVQITVNNCFPFSVFKKSTRHLLVDCVLEDNKQTKQILNQYKGKLNTWWLYTEEENVGIPQFDTDEDMLKFMYEVEYKSMQKTVTFY